MTEATLYYATPFGWASIEIKMEEYGTMPYAQYKDCPYVKYVEKRKRTKILRRFSNKLAVIVDGWNQPKPPSAFDGQITKYGCFDTRYDCEFYEWLQIKNLNIITDFK